MKTVVLFLVVVFVVAAAAARTLAATPSTTIDITHRLIARRLPNYGSPRGIPPFIVPQTSINSGDAFNSFNFTLNTHWGTHVDAPGHFNQTLLDLGYDVDHLDVTTLRGPCLVVDIPRDKNITEQVMRELDIPRGVKRVLFKTLNTDRRLMHQAEFDGSYTAFTTTGARYLVDNTDIKLVGIDYLSIGIGVQDEVIGVHLTLLNMKDIIPVEGLNLDDVVPGIYTVRCHPLRFPGFDGSPARCILQTLGSSARWLSPTGSLVILFFHLIVYFCLLS